MNRSFVAAVLIFVAVTASADAGWCRRCVVGCCRPACCEPAPSCCVPISTGQPAFLASTSMLPFGIQPAYYSYNSTRAPHFIETTSHLDIAVVYELPEAPKPIPKVALYRGRPITAYQAMMLGLPTLPQN